MYEGIFLQNILFSLRSEDLFPVKQAIGRFQLWTELNCDEIDAQEMEADIWNTFLNLFWTKIGDGR